jgi:hypothetical protein
MESRELIKKLLSNIPHALISFISVAYIEFTNDEEELSGKVKWYLQTAELVINEDNIVSKDEIEEFARLHLAYMEKINTQKLKIPFGEILEKFENGVSPIECLTNKTIKK